VRPPRCLPLEVCVLAVHSCRSRHQFCSVLHQMNSASRSTTYSESDDCIQNLRARIQDGFYSTIAYKMSFRVEHHEAGEDRKAERGRHTARQFAHYELISARIRVYYRHHCCGNLYLGMWTHMRSEQSPSARSSSSYRRLHAEDRDEDSSCWGFCFPSARLGFFSSTVISAAKNRVGCTREGSAAAKNRAKHYHT